MARRKPIFSRPFPAGGPAPWRVDRGGFTLTEILVVLLILTIGIVPIAVLQSNARRDVSKSDRYTQAVALAQSRIEQMRGAGFGSVFPDSGAVGLLSWTSDVQNVSLGLDRVGVTVTWFDGRRQQALRVVSLVSLR